MAVTQKQDLLLYENRYAAGGYTAICGVDEAGRGPLAGPVFAAAVILHPGQQLPGVRDSKKLNEAQREALYDVITAEARAFGVGSASEREIDDINILNATFLAMHRAVHALGTAPDLLLVDGNRSPGIEVETQLIVGGDDLSLSIAAASILAKVARDRYMLALDSLYPQYGFARHKGYPTKYHYEMLRAHGPCAIHRCSFLKNLTGAKGDAKVGQR